MKNKTRPLKEKETHSLAFICAALITTFLKGRNK